MLQRDLPRWTSSARRPSSCHDNKELLELPNAGKRNSQGNDYSPKTMFPCLLSDPGAIIGWMQNLFVCYKDAEIERLKEFSARCQRCCIDLLAAIIGVRGKNMAEATCSWSL